MVTYARNDTRYLKPLADILRAELSRRRRLSWHEQMCAQLVRESVRTVVEDPDLIWRVKGANRLDRRSLAVLRELWFWREREALGASLPPFFILSHETLLDMAQASGQGRSVEALIPGRYSPRRRSALHKAIERAHHLPEAKLPALHRPHGQRLSPEGRRRAEQFRLRRDRQAAALGLEPALIASRAMLLTLARNWEKHSVELLPWQRELLQA
jgi:ribonuclease D